MIAQRALFGFPENIERIYIYHSGIYLSDRNLTEPFGKYFANFEIFLVIFRIGITNFLRGMQVNMMTWIGCTSIPVKSGSRT